MSQLERITFNPNQCGGRPCVRDMRIRVKDVRDMVAGGASQSEILKSDPDLEREDIQAALEYAARQVDHAVLSLAKWNFWSMRNCSGARRLVERGRARGGSGRDPWAAGRR